MIWRSRTWRRNWRAVLIGLAVVSAAAEGIIREDLDGVVVGVVGVLAGLVAFLWPRADAWLVRRRSSRRRGSGRAR